jgi:hypothetical protein
MADCNFSINFSGSASDIVTKIKSEIEKQGGNFDGNETAGSFSVKVFGSTIAGSYTATATQIDVNITSKPMFISCGQVESFLKSQIGG